MTEIDLVYNLIDAFNNSNKEAEDIKMLLRTLLDRNIALAAETFAVAILDHD